ncbi:MAG: thioredoxin-disulfide reductase [Lachnospiraceae bacterium]|nr:thioredoxin-disulfide reductase [Lachnospiraceae bacterium]
MYDLIIIGSGPAGLSAAIYASRAGLNFIIIEENIAGGQIINTFEIDNYPGIPRSSGIELAGKMEDHARRLCDKSFIDDSVESAELAGDVKKIHTVSGSVYESRTVIIATGATHKRLMIKGEDDFNGKGVSYCATCDGAFFKGKNVTVVGGGNTAAMDALFLSGVCSNVRIIHRRNVLRADKVLQDRLFTTDNIEVIWNTGVEEICGSDKVTGVVVKDLKSGTDRLLETDGVFVAVGITPMADPFGDVLETDKDGYIIADETCASSIPGVFAAGDVRSKALRQVVTAVADGANAVAGVSRYLIG